MFVNFLLIILLPLLFVGIVNKIKALWAGRKGPSILQPFYTCLKLCRKSEVRSQSSGFIFKAAPSLALAASLMAALFVPFGGREAVFSFRGDFVLFMYLLAFAKAVMVLAAMDTGSSFEGMGASREISFTAFLEPAFLLTIASLVYAGGVDSM
ncbi:MAG TPA: NADH-quinone oxidoreductase subunit H, partial [Candidatus Cloacimonadota bacterium]|nr:NADH-quinone oxidoreductase subunit H [Candidatus Cloacimonadota bacterium]